MWLVKWFNKYQIKLLNQFYGHLKASVYIYVHLKHYFKSGPKYLWILKILAVLLSPTLFTIIWSLKLYKAMMKFKIQRTVGTDFVRMLDGTELIFLEMETEKMRLIIASVLLVEWNGPVNELHELCQQRIVSIFNQQKFWKFHCSIELQDGYYYFKKSNHSSLDCFLDLPTNNNNNNNNIIKDTISMAELQNCISEIANEELPNNNKALWEVRIGQNKLARNDDKNLYPLVFRFHHTVGDAVSLFNMFTSDFQTSLSGKAKLISEEVVRPLDETFDHPFITMSGVIDSKDDNVLCQLNGNKHVVWITEETPEILQLTKEIKKKIESKVTVVDILLTCLLESIESHLKHNNIQYPNDIWTVVPMMPPDKTFTDYGTHEYELENKISLGFLKLPLKMPSNSIRERLERINKEYDIFKTKSVDFMCNRWQGKVILSLLPHYLSSRMVNAYGISLMVSNLPGCSNLNLFDQLKVHDFIVIDPNTSISGVSVMITSYDKRLSIAYTIDKAVVPKVEDVHTISEKFLSNLRILQSQSSEVQN